MPKKMMIKYLKMKSHLFLRKRRMIEKMLNAMIVMELINLYMNCESPV